MLYVVLYFMLTLIMGGIVMAESDKGEDLFLEANLLGKTMLIFTCFGFVVIGLLAFAGIFLAEKQSKLWNKFCIKKKQK